jgi:uncharacterized membrane protein HdeD (DUF308 family)
LTNQFVDYANTLSQAYGGGVVVHRLGVFFYLAVALLVVDGILMLLAVQSLRERKAMGWNLLFYSVLLNAVYGVVAAFQDFGGAGRLVSALVGTVVGLYFLFQIRDQYKAKASKKVTAAKEV